MAPPIVYTPKVFADPDVIFNSLLTLDWEKRADAPRHEYYVNDFPKPYVYGVGRGRREYLPRPSTQTLLTIRGMVEAMASTKFEVCFLNRYLNQSDQLGWHADDSPEMDDARPIAIVSFGVEREIWFRPKMVEGYTGPGLAADLTKLKLGHGSVCMMQPGMQDTWQHRIPKASFTCGERISLTFRGYVEQP